MGENSAKFFDTEKTNAYFGDLQDAIGEYEKFADEHLLDVDAVISTNSWQGADADAAKQQLTDIEKNVLEEIIQLQKDVDSLDAEIMTNFGTMVDKSSFAHVEYNILEKVDGDFKTQFTTFQTNTKEAATKISSLQSRFSGKYGGRTISTPDFSAGNNAFEDICGGDSANSGFLYECMKKLVDFDADAKSYIEEQKIGEKIESLNKQMCTALHFRHPEYGLGQYLDDIDKFEEELGKIQIKIILHKDLEKWTVEDAMRITKYYYNATKSRDWNTVQTILQELETTYSEKGAKVEDGKTYDLYVTYLDPNKSYVMLSFLSGMGLDGSEAFSVLSEMSGYNMAFYIPRGAYTTQPNISILTTQKDYGIAVYWSAYRGGERLGTYQSVIFDKDGLTSQQKYDLIKDDKYLPEYNKQIKAIKDIDRTKELQELYNDAKDVSKGGYNPDLRTNNDSNVYKYINDPSYQIAYAVGGSDPYGEDCYQYLTDYQIRVYNYLYYQDSLDGTDKADEYLDLLIPSLRQKAAQETYARMNNGKGWDGLEKFAYEYYVGLDEIVTGVENYFNLNDDRDGVARYTVTENVDQLIMSNASEGEALAYKISKMAGGMTPGIIVTLGTGGAGGVAMVANGTLYGTSAGGNAKAGAERSGYSLETAEAYGNAIAVEEALKIGAFTYMAGPGGKVFSGCSVPMGLLGRGVSTFALEFVDEAGIKPGLAYLVLDDREAFNNLDFKDILLNCTMASGTVMVIHGVEEFRAYKNAKASSLEDVNALLLGDEELIEPLERVKVGNEQGSEIDFSDSVYDGVRKASEYLKEQGVPRQFRKQILESFDVRTIEIKIAGDNTYGIRFYGGNANAEGRYLFETFSPLTNRENLALPYEWNSMTGIQQFKVRNGAIIISGEAASQINYGSQYVGGANQWYINNLEDLIKCH